MKTDEAGAARQDRPVNRHPIYRVDAVEHKILLPVLARRFQRQAQRRSISIESATDVLNIEHEGVEVFELFRLGLEGRAV